MFTTGYLHTNLHCVLSLVAFVDLYEVLRWSLVDLICVVVQF